MRRIALLCLLVVAPAWAADPEVATVLIQGHRGTGSGAVVWSDGKTSVVLTNKHVCPDGFGQIRVRAGGKSHAAVWLGSDPDCDVAALRISAGLEPLRLAAAEPQAGTDVRLYGYGGHPKYGKVVGYAGYRYVGTGDAYKMTLVSQPGDSGAPVVNGKGEVIGLNWGVTQDGHGACVRLSELKRAMARWVKN